MQYQKSKEKEKHIFRFYYMLHVEGICRTFNEIDA